MSDFAAHVSAGQRAGVEDATCGCLNQHDPNGTVMHDAPGRAMVDIASGAAPMCPIDADIVVDGLVNLLKTGYYDIHGKCLEGFNVILPPGTLMVDDETNTLMAHMVVPDVVRDFLRKHHFCDAKSIGVVVMNHNASAMIDAMRKNDRIFLTLVGQAAVSRFLNACATKANDKRRDGSGAPMRGDFLAAIEAKVEVVMGCTCHRSEL